VSGVAVLTTRARLDALVRMLDHEHIGYTDDGALVRAFLKDAETALVNPVDLRAGWDDIEPIQLDDPRAETYR
jgi:hypothetical protein